MTVTHAEAMTADCPKCKVVAGELCVYTADMFRILYSPYSKDLVHRKGEPILTVAHAERRAVVRRRREIEGISGP